MISRSVSYLTDAVQFLKKSNVFLKKIESNQYLNACCILASLVFNAIHWINSLLTFAIHLADIFDYKNPRNKLSLFSSSGYSPSRNSVEFLADENSQSGWHHQQIMSINHSYFTLLCNSFPTTKPLTILSDYSPLS